MQVTFEDLKYLVLTLFGEARGESLEGKIAVAWVIMNRAKKSGTSIYSVCLAPYQFSCWNRNDPNYALITNPKFDVLSPSAKDCFTAAMAVLFSEKADPTKGSRHYCVTTLNPSWAAGHVPVYTVGAHKFYNDVA